MTSETLGKARELYEQIMKCKRILDNIERIRTAEPYWGNDIPFIGLSHNSTQVDIPADMVRTICDMIAEQFQRQVETLKKEFDAL